MKKLIVLGAIFLSGCVAIRGGKVVSLPHHQHRISCIYDQINCDYIATDACRGSYQILQRSEMEFLIQCKQ